MRYLYAVGGRQRSRLFRTDPEWNLYNEALIIRIDTHAGTAETKVAYVSPPEVCAIDKMPSILFKAGTLHDDKLYLCTSTEVLIFALPGFRQVGYLTLPCFNDLHHVHRAPTGNLLIANTGLDMVIELSPKGVVRHEWNVLGDDPWGRFSRDIDYRKIASTKPHLSHPNFVFQIGDELWVTRGHQGDAISLENVKRNVTITSEIPHDGIACYESIFFTTVDGTIVIASQESLKIQKIVDLKTINSERKVLLGWCRGLCLEDETHIWVGFTRVRKTTFKENVNWVKHVFHDTEAPTHIALYDIESKQCLKEIDLEQHGMNVIFGIYPAT